MGKVLRIDSPTHAQQCGWAQEVKGKVWCHKGELLQTMVLAADNLWYPQPAVERHGKKFTGLVYLGWETDPQANAYRIAVGAGGERIGKPIEQLPEDILWTSVIVERI